MSRGPGTKIHDRIKSVKIKHMTNFIVFDDWTHEITVSFFFYLFYIELKRMFSSRMRTDRLETACVSVSVAVPDVTGGGRGFNQNEHVWTGFHHQMSLTGGTSQVWCPGGGEYESDLFRVGYPTLWPIPWCYTIAPCLQTDTHMWKHYLPVTWLGAVII